jgi:hypothetical protein
MRTFLATLALLLFSAIPAIAQTTPAPPADAPPPPVINGPFAISAGTMTINSKGQTVAAATIQGLLAVTTNFRVRDDNILAPSVSYNSFMGGQEYSFLHYIKNSKLKPNTWDAYEFAEAGPNRITLASGVIAQHIGFHFGGGLRYDPSGSGNFSMTIAEVGALCNSGLSKGCESTFRSSITWNLTKAQ